MKDKPMKRTDSKKTDELRPEYDLRELMKGAVRGKYAKAYRAGTNLVPLDPDVRRAFPDQKTVNEALRLVIKLHEHWEQVSMKKFLLGFFIGLLFAGLVVVIIGFAARYGWAATGR